ncbi:DUF3347 domain-containing protein [Pedobacter sp. MR22-3]|uniref:DUF3347 domain-containing protein n=1 Tax=Pedobacter sp. MR22-3 TaxID=2994552 RepID=UPI002246DB3D|nr:DUF3347 domain-containing protein [Pedobacter sp. MR22-3]MCX2585485.1 DUF3347 domain-containing protein [Pedobacter sp. MR22-3]
MKQIFGLAILFTFIACNQSEKKSAGRTDSIQSDTLSKNNQVSIKDKKKEDILIKYVNLKNALVKSDEKLTQKNAADLQKSLADFEGCEPTAEVAGKIAGSGNLIDQRKGFTILSSDLIALMKGAEIEKGTIFVQHCPMANKGDGGDWLSTEKEIRNPYYGNEMLECGRVTEELKAN